jgi:hypothetical protein
MPPLSTTHSNAGEWGSTSRGNEALCGDGVVIMSHLDRTLRRKWWLSLTLLLTTEWRWALITQERSGCRGAGGVPQRCHSGTIVYFRGVQTPMYMATRFLHHWLSGDWQVVHLRTSDGNWLPDLNSTRIFYIGVTHIIFFCSLKRKPCHQPFTSTKISMSYRLKIWQFQKTIIKYYLEEYFGIDV